jgi:hypothetical protein
MVGNCQITGILQILKRTEKFGIGQINMYGGNNLGNNKPNKKDFACKEITVKKTETGGC